MSLLFMLGALAVLLRSWRREGRLGLCAAALTAFNPLAAAYAPTLMSESAFLFFTVWTLARLARILDRERPPRLREALALAALAGFCAWIRPQGAALVLAASWLLIEKPGTRRAGRAFAVAAFGVAALPYCRNWLVSGVPAAYFDELPGPGGPGPGRGLDLLETVASNLARFPSMIVTEGMLHWLRPLPGEGSWAAKILGLALSFWILRGLASDLRREGFPRAASAYAAAYLGLHLFWVNQLPRYALPVLPFLYRSLLLALRPWPRLLAAAAATLLALFLALDLRLASLARIPARERGLLPQKTLEWLRGRCSQDRTLLTFYKELFYLYAGCRSVSVFSPDPDEWHHRLLSERAAYVMQRLEGEVHGSTPPRRRQLEEVVALARERLSDASRYRLAFEAPEESFAAYEVLRPAGFEEGYRRLAEAKGLIRAGDWSGAYETLRQIPQDAPLTRLPFYKGTTALVLGRLEEAEGPLEEALRREPAFEPARRNLARLRAAR